ncbi:MAG: hypothetical protein AAGF12_30625 [Myxococcota bacterium]
MADPKPKIYINVPVTAAERERLERQEHTWSSMRLVVLTVVSLGISLVVLYLMAQTTSETYWSDWLIPG